MPVTFKRKPRTVCDECTRAMPKAHAVYDGKGYCTTCYYRLTTKADCVDCGKPTRIFDKGPAICKSCRTKGRSCIRCGKDVPQAGLIVDGGVACPSCARFFKEPAPCPVCGQMSLHLSRDFKKGFTEPVCQHCRRKGHITCPCCGKDRRPAGTTTAGKVVCETCLKVDGKPFTCPNCGKEGKRHSKDLCVECYWRRSGEIRLRDAMALLRNEWVRNAFSSFMRDITGRIDPQKAALRLSKYFLFFAVIDGHFSSPTDVTPESLARLFGGEGLRRHTVPFDYMVRQKLLPKISEDTLEEETENARQEAIVNSAEVGWVGDLLREFRKHLISVMNRYRDRGWVGKHRRFLPRTVTSALKASETFLGIVSGECMSIQQIDQVFLDRYAAMYPGKSNSVRAFIRFLNTRKVLFKKLKVPLVRANLPPRMFLEYDKYGNLLRTWLNPDDAKLKESLICCFMLLYAQTVKKTVRLYLSDISKGNNGLYRITFGRTEITLDQQVGALMGRYIEKRKALSVMEEGWENEYLFPGRKMGEHLSEATVTYYLKKQGVRADTLFSSAILYAYQSGVKHPNSLVKAFGISNETAIKYMELVNPRLRDELEKLVANA